MSYCHVVPHRGNSIGVLLLKWGTTIRNIKLKWLASMTKFKVGFENEWHSGQGTWTVTVDYAFAAMAVPCHRLLHCTCFWKHFNVLCWLTWVPHPGRKAWFLVYFVCLLDVLHTILIQAANIFLHASPHDTRLRNTLRQLLIHMWASPTPKTSSPFWKTITGGETHQTLNWMTKIFWSEVMSVLFHFWC